MRLFPILLIFAAVVAAFPQSGRVSPGLGPGQGEGSDPGSTTVSVKQMFDEVNGYIKTKAAEFDAKKVPFNERLLEQVKLEQRQLAAKYASTAETRKGLAGEDLYYLGMLHWIAGNYDGTSRNLGLYITDKGAAAEHRQTARSIYVVAMSKQNHLDEAEKALNEYLSSEPAKQTERARMESELAKAYQAQNDFARMTPHAEEAYKASKAVLNGSSSRSHTLDEILDAGMLVYEGYRSQGNLKKAEDALDDMRSTAVVVQSPSFYYYSVDQKIKFLIESARRQQATEFYLASLVTAGADFKTPSQQADAISRIKKRETHYKLLGEAAPELPAGETWFPGKPSTLAELKGKVVMLEFWATWCGPCYETFPSLTEWQQDFGHDGLVILGVTRLYGRVDGLPADAAAELEYLKKFRRDEKLNYDFVVGTDQTLQFKYGATGLPTTVLIDKRGIIRYIESGTSPERIDEIRAMIAKLINEK